MRKLNTGGLAALLLALAALDAIYRYQETTDGFRLFCWAILALSGGLVWVSFSKFGILIKRGSNKA